MFSFSNIEMKHFFGKKTRDIYGRYLGQVVAILKNSDGELESIKVDQSEGRLVKYSAEQMMTNKDEIVIIPEWKIQAEQMIKELNTFRSRMDALEAMLEKEEVSKEIYENLKANQKQSIDSLKGQNNEFISSMKQRQEELDRQINELTNFLVEIRTGKKEGKIESSKYTKASKSIEQNLNFLFLEKKDVEDIIKESEEKKLDQNFE
ncbi:MAG: CdvA-like protein [Candidatus Bathyarchaeota archaeon]|nr:CdvA-like protein [Candidatus Bathyarchaeota archaeon]